MGTHPFNLTKFGLNASQSQDMQCQAYFFTHINAVVGLGTDMSASIVFHENVYGSAYLSGGLLSAAHMTGTMQMHAILTVGVVRSVSFESQCRHYSRFSLDMHYKADYTTQVNAFVYLSLDFYRAVLYDATLLHQVYAGKNMYCASFFVAYLQMFAGIFTKEVSRFTYCGIIPQGREVYIDSSMFSVSGDHLDTGDNLLQYFGGEWPFLDRDVYGVMLASAHGTTPSVEIIYTERFL
jgi:hypothetical protein